MRQARAPAKPRPIDRRVAQMQSGHATKAADSQGHDERLEALGRSRRSDSMTQILHRHRFQLKGAAALALLSLAIPSSAAMADGFKARYSVKLIGLSLGSATLEGSVEPDAYQIDATAKLSGVAALVSSSRGAASASGLMAQGRIAPNAYATTSANATMTRTVRMAMAAGNVKASEIAPPFEELPGRVLVTEAHKQKIIDPLSALIMTTPEGGAVIGPAACNRSLPIYDGWARFNVNLTYLGQRQVKVKGYEGPVAVCAARYVAVAGHRPDRAATKYMENNKEMEVWLAPVGASRATVPFRISVATMVGTTVIEATEFQTSPPEKSASR